jgi:hypothetical protein
MSAETQTTTYTDKKLTCVECKDSFTFTARDQEFYAQKVNEKTGKGWDEPKRCRTCREKRKAAKAEREATGK